MRAYVQQAAAEQLTAEMGPGAADIAEIVAELMATLFHRSAGEISLLPFENQAAFISQATDRVSRKRAAKLFSVCRDGLSPVSTKNNSVGPHYRA